jgi:uncharacterized surface protein with fasciclin (FAS1) repeats
VKSQAFALGIAAALIAVGGCSNEKKTATGAPPAQSENAQKVAGAKTIAAGLAPGGRFMAAAKAAGLDQTLAGPGPYTVFVPDDAAFNAAPAGMFGADPKNRAQTTSVLTNLILPGTVLAADIGKAIDHGNGKAILATMSGNLTATRDGSKIVLTDSGGHKATVTQADDQFSNGVVHHVDALLLPGKTRAMAAVGEKPGG